MSETGSVSSGLLAVRALLVDVLDRGFDKRSWHGANLKGAIRGLRAADAARRVPGRKCAWEQVLHAAYWKHRVLKRLVGPEKFPRKGSNWPALPVETTEDAWRADVALLRDINARLRAAVAALPKERLDAKTMWLIEGAAAHDVYHAGQIKLLRRLTSVAASPGTAEDG
jgi:hypothetical protein